MGTPGMWSGHPAAACAPLILGLCFLVSSPGWSKPAVFINEVMASNTKTLADPQGDFDDWIELFNAGDTPVDLTGMYL